jgi:phage FluMu protein Com
MEDLKCYSCNEPLATSTGKLQNNVWTVVCPECKAINKLVPDPNRGGALVAKKRDAQ